MGKHLLKDCPFCGGKAEQKYSDGYVWIECTQCKAMTDSENSDYYETGLHKAIEIIVEKWNKRT